MKKVVYGVIVFLYVIVSVFVTTCLLSYNDYRISVFDDTSLIIINDDNKIGDYKNGSLLVVKKDMTKVTENDDILYYDTRDNEVKVKIAKVAKLEQITDEETTLTLENNESLSSEYVIGAKKEVKNYALVGLVLGILESRWGYLIIIILPILLVFIYEIVELIKELKKQRTKEKKGKKNEKTKN